MVGRYSHIRWPINNHCPYPGTQQQQQHHDMLTISNRLRNGRPPEAHPSHIPLPLHTSIKLQRKACQCAMAGVVLKRKINSGHSGFRLSNRHAAKATGTSGRGRTSAESDVCFVPRASHWRCVCVRLSGAELPVEMFVPEPVCNRTSILYPAHSRN